MKGMKYLVQFITFDNSATPVLDDATVVYDAPPGPPLILKEDPYHSETLVAVDRDIVIYFSEPMDVLTVTWTITPFVAVVDSWADANGTLTLNPSTLLKEAQVYLVQISGKDLDGNDVIIVPGDPLVANPFAFATISEPPYVTDTDPVHIDVDVPVDHKIFVNFSEEMNASTISWTADPFIDLTSTYGPLNQSMILSHVDDFQFCTQYEIQVFGEDLVGNFIVQQIVANPWVFDIVCPFPFITSTNPGHLQGMVATDDDITVTFSKEVDNTTLTWDIDPLIGLTPTWSGQNTTLIFTHASPFTVCTAYEVTIINVKDLGGNDLTAGPVPNPWTFMTICPNPYITTTDPANAESDVEETRDIQVYFNKAIDTATFEITISPFIALTPTWNPPSNDIVTLTHLMPLGGCTQYWVDVTQANDTSGNTLVPGPAPNPWSFNTTCVNPVILYTDPQDGNTSVPLNQPIVVKFDREMDIGTLDWTIAPQPGGWTPGWTETNSKLTLTHSNLYETTTTYNVRIVDINDTSGNPLGPSPVPNPWDFTTAAESPAPYRL